MLRTARRTGRRPACSKRGCSPTYRPHQGRSKLEAAYRLRWPGPSARHAAQRGADERLQGRCLDDRCSAQAKTLLGDKGYDADWLRTPLAQRGIAVCISSKANRKVPIPHDTALDRRCHTIAIMFGRLKDWRRIPTRYDRCAPTVMSAITIAATLIFWRNQ